MKINLLPLTGTTTDQSIFDTALALAGTERTHLHAVPFGIEMTGGLHAPTTAEFSLGDIPPSWLHARNLRKRLHSSAPHENFRELCAHYGIPILNKPDLSGAQPITASWQDAPEAGEDLLLHQSRLDDVLVMSWPAYMDGLPPDTLRRLVLNTGCPLLLSRPETAVHLLERVLVCWNGSAESAHALALAMPLLQRARHVQVVSVVEAKNREGWETLQDVQIHLAWRGIRVEAQVLEASHQTTAERLAAYATEWRASLLVMGAYGRSSMAEMLFGGCTEWVLAGFPVPVFLMH